MSTPTFSKRSIKTKQTIDQTIATESPVKNAKHQQDFFEKTIQEQKKQYQLLRQIEEARRTVENFANQYLLKNYNNSLPNNQQTLKVFEDIQKEIQMLNQQNISINKEIQSLRGNSRQLYKEEVKSVRNRIQSQYQELAEEVSHQKRQIFQLQNQFKRKKEQLGFIKKIVGQRFQTYLKILGKKGRKIITFEDFKQRRKQKSRQRQKQMKASSNKKSRKNLLQTKQSVQLNSNRNNLIHSVQLKDMQEKRLMAETAIKVEKKKHQLQLNQLNGKLDFLREQDQTVTLKLRTIKQQLYKKENRFSGNKQQGSIHTKKYAKLNRHSQPEM